MTEWPRIKPTDYCNEDLPTLTQPWWRTLPRHFHALPDHFLADNDTRWRIDYTASLDTVARTGLACMAGAAALPASLNVKQQQEERELVRFYEPFLDCGDPQQFFTAPQQHPVIQYHPVARYHFQPEDGQAHTLSFRSPFEPKNPALRDRYLAHKRNRTAWAQYWKHDGEPRPTLIMIHGFVADPYWLNTRWLALPWFYKQGFDVLLYTLPFHGRRKSPLAPFSGAQFFSQGMAMLNETFAHAIHDLRIFMNHLREGGTPAMGATGISLGGYSTALLSSLEKDLAFAIPNVPLVTIMDLMKSWFPVNLQFPLFHKVYDTDFAGLRKLTALHSPLTWPSLVPQSARMIIGGAGDRFAPPKHTDLLRQHWDDCHVHWFPGNHMLHLDQGSYLRNMRDFMRDALQERSVELSA
ncbi:alpha/beta hydrolase [Alcanivorax sediminis]|uniref:Abhydrolase domain-containing 18 n=1 Tax=Alcanivorax sediminis TaxID=2663008 RepID=A0A6N7LNT2_9GAMM|nr:alpha/beta fold hydrolase [Alcanivorax sediminis]MQX51718.1 abhydrolase domain-containing 18 [Alcanivorax sediminis]